MNIRVILVSSTMETNGNIIVGVTTQPTQRLRENSLSTISVYSQEKKVYFPTFLKLVLYLSMKFHHFLLEVPRKAIKQLSYDDHFLIP